LSIPQELYSVRTSFMLTNLDTLHKRNATNARVRAGVSFLYRKQHSAVYGVTVRRQKWQRIEITMI